MIKVVMFDFGGVYFTEGYFYFVNKIHEELNIPMRKLTKCFYWSGSGFTDYYSLGKMNREEFWEKVRKYLKIDKKTARTMELMRFNSFKPIKGMKQLVTKLRKNYKVVMVSGNELERVRYLNKKYSFLKEFDECFFTYQYKVHKYKIKFWQIILKKLEIQPNEAIMVEDDIRNVRAFRKFGINAILFKNPQQLEIELGKLGVKI